MFDTNKKFQKKQIEIILSKKPSERAMMGVDMIDSVLQIVKNSIIGKHPNYNEREIVAEIFKRYYKNDFPKDKIEEIMNRIKSISL
jgi:hypothetical protein